MDSYYNNELILQVKLEPESKIAEKLEPISFICKMCKSQFTTKTGLDHHIQEVHTTKGSWVHCQLCEYKFRKASKLAEHMVACHSQGQGVRNLTMVEELVCSLCSFSCSTSFTLVQHQAREHCERAEADGQFACGRSSSKFKTFFYFISGSCPFRASTLNAIKSHRYLTHFQRNLENVCFDISLLVCSCSQLLSSYCFRSLVWCVVHNFPVRTC